MSSQFTINLKTKSEPYIHPPQNLIASSPANLNPSPEKQTSDLQELTIKESYKERKPKKSWPPKNWTRALSKEEIPRRTHRADSSSSSHKELIKPLHIEIPIEAFVRNVIDIKEIPFMQWKAAVFTELTKKTRSAIKANPVLPVLSDEKIESMIEGVLSVSLRFSAITLRINKAAAILSNIKQYVFLTQFKNCEDPEQFWIFNQKLESSQQVIINKIIGLGIVILKQCTGLAKQAFVLDCQEQVQAVTQIDTLKIKLIKTNFKFLEGFDTCAPQSIPTPICFTMPNDILLLFHTYTKTEPVTKPESEFTKPEPDLSTLLTFNSDTITLPAFGKIETDHERFQFLAAHLLKELHSKMGIDEVVSVKDQLSLFFDFKPPFNLDIIKSACCNAMKELSKEEWENVQEYTVALSKMLPGEMDKEELNYPHMISAKFESTNSLINTVIDKYLPFCTQILSNVIKVHHDFYDRASQFSSAIYPRLFYIYQLEQRVPLIRYLQALSFNSYAIVDQFLQRCLCPELKNDDGDYYTKYTPPAVATNRLKTHYISETQDFSVTHFIPYTIELIKEKKGVQLHAAHSSPHRRQNMAKIIFHWTISGNLQESDYTARLKIASIHFTTHADPIVRLEILKKFKTKWEDNPWQGYVKQI